MNGFLLNQIKEADPNKKVLGLNHHFCHSIWGLKHYCLGPWTLKEGVG